VVTLLKHRSWALAMLLVACAPDPSTAPDEQPTIAPPDGATALVAFANGQSTDTINVQETVQATAWLSPPGAKPKAVKWASRNTAVAVVTNTGLVTGTGAGSVYIVATSGPAKDSGLVVVQALTVDSVEVSPSSAALTVSGTQQFTATLRDAGGNTVSKPVTWASTNTAVVTVSSAGLATGVATGSAFITATSEGVIGSATVTVGQAAVNTITVAPSTASIGVGATQQFAATLKDASNNTLTGRTVVWSSSNNAVAQVSATGLATGLAAGSATITASSEGKDGTATLTVVAAAADTVFNIVMDGYPAKCLTARGSSNTSKVEISDCAGTSLQKWYVSGTTIRLSGTSACLDDDSEAGNSNTELTVYACHSGTNQQWTWTAGLEIRGMGTSCVDEQSHVGTNGTIVELWTCNGAAYQKWRKVPPGGGVGPAVPVFPGAVGFGAMTPAGRMGRVIRVKNLNNSGDGSLRAALTDSAGPRTIICEISGTIALASKIAVPNGYVTFAGQTCPSPGLTIRNYGISIRAPHVLIQHLRIRHGASQPSGNYDAMEILGPFGANVVIDHVSMSWGVDENFSTWYGGAQNITLSNSIVSEGVASAGEPGKGLLLGDSTRNLAVIGNLIANNQDRSPYWKGYSTGVQVNNLIYNWGGNQASYTADPEGSGPAQVSIVGNRFVRGPSTPSGSPIQIYSSSATGTKVYVADNADGRTASPPSDPWSLVYNQEGSGAVATFAPVWPNGFTAASVPSVSAVTSKAGACPNWRDAVDTRIVDEVTNGTGSATSFTMIWPSLSQGTTSHSVPSNPHGDDDTDGYTNLEEWLHGFYTACGGH
jgi:uncharacterized protein YjdB